MKDRCRFCRRKLEESEAVCPFCGIDKAKSKKELTEDEEKIAGACWFIRFVGGAAYLGGILILASTLSAFAPGRPAWMGYYIAAFGAGYLLVGYGLRRYKRWSFYLATICFSYMILLALQGLIGVLFGPGAFSPRYILGAVVMVTVHVILLYGVSGQTARKVLLHGGTKRDSG
jgi:hypothetical protein